MLEIISNKKYELLEFTPFVEYIKKLEQENYTLLSDIEEYKSREIIFKNDIEFLKILIFTDSEKEWISIYKYKEVYYNYYQTEFFLYNEKGVQFYKPPYNRFIRYASYMIEDEYTKLITSAFSYNDNQYAINSGWRQKRKIKTKDLKEFRTCGINLQELIIRAEDKNLTFYESIDETDGEVQRLKLTYDE